MRDESAVNLGDHIAPNARLPEVSAGDWIAEATEAIAKSSTAEAPDATEPKAAAIGHLCLGPLWVFKFSLLLLHDFILEVFLSLNLRFNALVNAVVYLLFDVLLDTLHDLSHDVGLELLIGLCAALLIGLCAALQLPASARALRGADLFVVERLRGAIDLRRDSDENINMFVTVVSALTIAIWQHFHIHQRTARQTNTATVANRECFRLGIVCVVCVWNEEC